ncbi:endonuclease/exonuclease/phosphatase family protein [Phaeovulum sp.]|uniref:endonuclease/exonuclease/phosphatase family protein n=1 Tax=Phaeovulum sp. TaxID=2934796 RepID=UPI00272FFC49|nr:endonuclease/exonuclease/phosphatase family protein [Phaeovulum sp.]MDP1670395.1 endonuclease/exonuclease/phosphatase family protein [Phaeovulum sp.]MDP2061869.1 endonuclease/exonuclease/phosphatase family protein [Phaeovulum sp.]MDP3861627.1 endonuclease/exonuclease/phosphatase family protein [Phaeovulum sp.]MDZ4120724.1 endonuclease/exonuclease/phosphatase family protein [Phaeovulum sp.]
MILRIASYNIHKSKGSDGRFDPARVIDVINALGADVLALQEVDFRFRGRPSALPLAVLRAGCALLPVALTPTGPESLGWHGQTLLLGKNVRLSALRPLVLPGFEPRGALIADIDAGSGPLRLVGVHLGLRRSNRRAQLAHIRAVLREEEDRPALIIGDFNEWAAAKGLEALHGFELTTPGPSYPARAPFGRLDRLAAGPGISVLRAGVFDSGLARRASDHLPIWADVRLST